MHVTLLARAHVWHPSAGREPLRGNIIQKHTKQIRSIVSVNNLSRGKNASRKCTVQVAEQILNAIQGKMWSTFSGHCSRAHCAPARWSLLVTVRNDPRLTLTSPSQRPTHSGSIFRLLLKIAVGLPRSCDSSQFLQGFGPNSNESKTWAPSLQAARPALAGVPS